jgi:hypothetical protein
MGVVMLFRVINPLVISLFCLPCFSQDAQSDIKVDYQISTGLDMWSVNGEGVRYLANYSTKNPYKGVTHWTQANVKVLLNEDFQFSLSGRAHGLDGNKITRLELDYKLNENNALSIGILPYRISWCAPSYNESSYIKETDPFCSFEGLNEISNSAAGVRYINTNRIGNWVLDSQIGYWKPTIDNMEKSLAIYTAVGPTTLHNKYGFSINAININSATQIRTGLLHSTQNQTDTINSNGYERRLRYDMFFVGVEKNITDSFIIRTTYSSYPGKQINPARPYTFTPTTKTITGEYKLTNGDLISLSHTDYINTTVYNNSTTAQLLKVNVNAISYRRDFNKYKMFAVFQYNNNSSYARTTAGKETILSGEQYGIRIGKNFK